MIIRYNEQLNKLNKRQIADSLKGKKASVAVHTWTTASGDIMPLSFKYQDHNMDTHLVKTFTVHRKEECRYYNEDCRVFECSGIIDNMLHSFKLVFFQTRCIWEMYVVSS